MSGPVLFSYDLPDGWQRGTYWSETYKIAVRPLPLAGWAWCAWVSADIYKAGAGFVLSGRAFTRSGADMKASNARIFLSRNRSPDPWPAPGESGVTPT